MPVGRQDVDGITDRDPTDRYGTARQQIGTQVYRCRRSDFSAVSKPSAVEYRHGSRDEDFILDDGSYHVGIWSDQTMVADRAGMPLQHSHSRYRCRQSAIWYNSQRTVPRNTDS